MKSEQLAMRNEKAGSRVCQALFSNPKARSKAFFRYAGAERIETHWWGCNVMM
jgi:hypothetical protein